MEVFGVTQNKDSLFYLPGDKLSLLITGITEPINGRILFIIYSYMALTMLDD